ncbi:reverse transcriptase domain-containing protein [Tanacetum coccineum]
MAEQIGVKNFFAKVDSRSFANQINESYIAKEQSMIKYLEKSRALIRGFKVLSIEQVPISENKQADALSKIAFISFSYLTKQVLIEVLKEKSIREKEIFTIVEEEGHTWMTLFFDYLMEGTLPTEAKKIQKRQERMMKAQKALCCCIRDEPPIEVFLAIRMQATVGLLIKTRSEGLDKTLMIGFRNTISQLEIHGELSLRRCKIEVAEKSTSVGTIIAIS